MAKVGGIERISAVAKVSEAWRARRSDSVMMTYAEGGATWRFFFLRGVHVFLAVVAVVVAGDEIIVFVVVDAIVFVGALAGESASLAPSAMPVVLHACGRRCKDAAPPAGSLFLIRVLSRMLQIRLELSGIIFMDTVINGL